MNRRQILLQCLAGGGSTLWNPWAGHAAERDNWQSQFEAADVPWKSAFATAVGDFPRAAAKVHGRFPDALAGTLYRVGPAGHDLGSERYHHWFDGDGMAHCFDIAGAEVHHQGRFVATAKRVAEIKAGRRLIEGFGTVFPSRPTPASPDSMNTANTNVLLLGGELLALWEGGSATRIDPRTLEARGFKTWRGDLAGAPFSAHPRVEPDGTVWNFGTNPHSGALLLYEIAADGVLRRADALPINDIPMIHDFAITQGHLVFLLPPLVYDIRRREAGASVLDSYVWRPEKGMRVLVVDKIDWKQRRIFFLPAGFLFHLGNAWEEKTSSGIVIHFDYARSSDAASILVDTREVMRARLAGGIGPRLTVVDLHLGTGHATQADLGIEAEFPRIDPQRVGQRHRRVLHATATRGGLPLWGSIAFTNVESGTSECFAYGPQAVVEEHLLVPDGQGSGWVIGTVLDYAQQKTVLSCFAADALNDGPVAQATLPYALPLGLHGTFVAK